MRFIPVAAAAAVASIKYICGWMIIGSRLSAVTHKHK